MKDKIVVRGAKEHNLKNVDLEIPRDKLVVFTGLSGSGKSSLAFDTIYAEGQRRYVESLSSYARQFLGQMEKPDVEYIEGLSPAISIDQKTTSRNPRSTVGTVTEIYDYLRLLFARVGTPHCPSCGKEIVSQSIDQMVDAIMELPEKTKLQLLAPVVRGKKGEHKKLLESVKSEGYVRVRVNGEIQELGEEISIDKNKKHNIEVVVDRVVVKPGVEKRLTDSIETVMKLGNGLLIVDVIDGDEIMMSQKFACPDCGIAIDEISPRMFSFNVPFGMCSTCNGLGSHLNVDPELVIPNTELSIREGAIAPFATTSEEGYYFRSFKSICEKYGFSLDEKIKYAPAELVEEILYGTGGNHIKFDFDSRFGGWKTYEGSFEGVIPNLERRFAETNSDYMRDKIKSFMSNKICPDCKGARLRPESLAVKLGGKNIYELTQMPIREELDFVENLELSEKQIHIARQILKEINSRLNFLLEVGLEYLTLSREAGTLSGGESQRIRLATQIGSSLLGVLYVLDEPSIGLHQRDNSKLLKALRNLTDIGNTLIVVEHDEDTMYEADYIVDIGPGAGVHGGEIVATGTVEEIIANEKSITGDYLSGRKRIEVPESRRVPGENSIVIKNASENNLKNIDVAFPTGVLTAVTGVSGSGKSTLVNEILYKGLHQKLHKGKEKPGRHSSIEGAEHIDKIIEIDQSPIGRTPRSNPATYTGIFDQIRDVFAMTQEAKTRGYSKGRFSFNVKGGRCEACKGDGIIKIEMHFLPDVYVPCEVCKGKRYNRETLQVKYKGKNISEILDMTVEEGVEFFENIQGISRKLKVMNDVGLGYIKLGQPSTQLSGGEAQRVKLATELSKRSTGKTIYILDEPTTGLHSADVHKLITVLDKLVESGNTVVVIEHNLDVIKVADYVVDLGPEGGDKGGCIVATGTPEEICRVPESYTGQFLAKSLKK
ncbi:UvrABC system protein A [Andreesenia angusta]|uniref:UvrABC system protein A n=1 Tax=Andreesenia angusta TaxID=39480 RepID=A0A1S1V614_9FIRM|nr:UvrABC system protein A [Andreesenia angusta]